MPGRKSDVSDAAVLAGRSGCARAGVGLAGAAAADSSAAGPYRARTVITRERSREAHCRGVARTRPDASRGRLRRNLRPATAIHDVPNPSDCGRHPQPRPGDAWPSPRPTVTPAPGHPVGEAPGSPSGRARVRGDRRPRCGAAAAGRAPGADRRAARCVDRMLIVVRPHHFRGVRDDTGRHRPGRATGAAAGAGRAAHRSGWPATVHADGAAPTDRRRPVT